MSTDALELALALHQAPIQRFGLRNRSLPPNIADALQIASAMQPQLELAAARFSQCEETMVEAVRFYLHQVLFEPGTDAYRVLGLQADAELSQIRQHHIWLQRWLHPDRRGEDWEAVLSTKVNWAWSQLRNQAAREQYDRVRVSTAETVGATDEHPVAIQVPAWNAAPLAKPGPHWLRRFAIGSLMVVCGCLLYLAVTRQDRVDPDALAWQSVEAQSSIRARLPFEEDASRMRSPATTPASVAQTATAPAMRSTTPAVAEQDQAGEKLSVTPSQSTPVPAAQAGSDGVQSETNERSAASDRRSNPSPAAQNSLTGQALEPINPPAANPVAIRQPEPVAKSPLADSAETSAPAASRMITGQTTQIAAPISAPPAMNRARQREPSSVASVQPSEARVAPPLDTPVVAGSARHETQSGGRVGETARPRQTPLASAPVPAAPDALNARSELTDERPPSISPELEAIKMGSVESQSASVAERQAELSPDELSRETLVRFEVARKRVRGVVDYFRGEGPRALKGSDDRGLLTVARELSALRARNAQVGTDAFALDTPTWRITHSLVSLQARYHVDAKNETAESGQLELNMAWRAGGWEITHMEVAPTR